MTKERVLYLYQYMAVMGFGHIRCRKLIETLKRQYVVELKNAIIQDDAFLRASELIKRETVPESDLLNGKYRVLIIEGSLGVMNAEESAKVRAAIVKKFTDNGGIVIFLLFDINEPINNRHYNAFLRNAGLPYIRNPRSEWEFIDAFLVSGDYYKKEIIFGYDRKHALRGGLFSIDINRDYLNVINSDVRLAYEGVSRLIVDHPVQLEGGKFLLTGNPQTRMISSGDLWWVGDPYAAFGMYNDFGNGVSATITGCICSDLLQDSQTDANKFLLNLVDLFIKYQNLRSPFLGLFQATRQMKKNAAAELAQALKEGNPEPIYDRITEETSRLVLDKIPIDQTRLSARFAEDKLKSCWEELEDKTRKFLLSGDTVYHLFKRALNKNLEIDFTGAILPFAKAIETELVTKLLDRFRIYLEKSGRLFQIIQDKNRVKKNVRLFDYLKESKKITLGDINFLFGCIESSDPVISELRNFLLTSKESNFWINKDAFPKTLNYTVKLRNGSAHDEFMTLEKCEEFRRIIFGIDGQESLILQITRNIPRL